MLNLNSQGSLSIQSKLQQLIYNIKTSKLDQIKQNSILNIHSKLQAKLISHEKLPIELPPVLMQWINNHQTKTLVLLKALQIINYYTKNNFGIQVLRQFEALEYFEGFREYLKSVAGMEEYQKIVDNVIQSLLPFGGIERESQREENTSGLGNVSRLENTSFPGRESQKRKQREEQSVRESRETPKQSPKILNSSILQKSNIQNLSFTIVYQDTEEMIERTLFDLSVQLRYGNLDVKYQTLRAISDILVETPSASFRNKVDLIKELEECVIKRIFENEAVSILVIIFKGLSQSSSLYRESFRADPKTKGIKFIFPLKHSYLQTPMMQPLLSQISSNFDHQWIQWLLPLKHPWTFPYIFKIINKLPHSIIQSSIIQQLLKSILSTSSIDYQTLTLQNNVIDLNKFQSFQTKESYNKIRDFENEVFNASDEKEEYVMEIIDRLKLGIEGLAYNPQLVSVYVETAMYVWFRHLQKLPLGEYYSTTLQYLLQISSHNSQPVRLRLYEIVLEKAYTEDISYCESSKSPSDIILSLLISDPNTLLQFISNSIDQKDTCLIYTLETLKLLYTHHQKPTHSIITQISPLLHMFSFSQPGKISNLSKHLLSKLNKKQLLSCDIMNIFSKQRKTRITASYQLFNYNGDLADLFQSTKPPKKPLKIDEDCIINYIINISNKDLNVSIRVSALIELIEAVKRSELTSLLTSRLCSLNELLMKEVMEMMNEETEEQVWIGYILALSLELYLKSVIQFKQLPNLSLLVLMVKAYSSGKCRELLNSLIGLLYVICFKSPFYNKASIHWYYMNGGDYIKVIHLEMKVRNICKIKEILGGQNKRKGKGRLQIDIPKITETKAYIEYVSSKLEGVETFQLKFNQIEQIVSKLFLSNAPAYQFSLIKTVFTIYQQNKHKFKNLSEQFQHLVPPLINYLNRETTKHIQDDILTILKIIGLKTQKQAQTLLNNKKIQLRTLDITKSIPKETVENVIRILPDDTAGLSKVLKSLLKKDCLREVESELGLISLSSSFQKGIRSKNRKLKLYCLQALFSILNESFVLKNTSFLTLMIEQLQDTSLTPMSTLISLRIPKKMILLSPNESFLQILQHSNLISISISWLSSHKNILIKIGCLQLLNSIANTSLVQSFDLTATYIDQINVHFEQEVNPSNQTIILKLIVIYQSLSGILFLSQHAEKQQFINYLLSTQLLYYIIRNIITIQSSIAAKLKSNAYLSKVLDAIGAVVMYLSESEDLFVMHLNKLTANNKKFIYTLSNLIECSGEQYSFMISRLVNIWNKSHKYLDDGQLGSFVLNGVLNSTSNNYELIKGLLAISHTAKAQFINKGYYLKYLQSALITIDEVILSHLSSQNKAKSTLNKKKTNLSMSSFSVISPKDPSDILQILNFLKSFYHPTQSQSQSSKLTISNQLSTLSVDLLSKLQECSHLYPQITTKQFKKVLCNLSCSLSHFHKVMIQLIDPKHSLVKDLIGNCLKENVEDMRESLELLGILGRQPEIRTLIFRNKLITELNGRILKNWEQRRNVEDIMVVVFEFYLHLSFHQDSQQKLINDKKILDLILIQLQKSINNYQSQLSTLILKLLCNVSYSKHNKPLLISNKDFHKTVLTLITNEEVDEKSKVYLGQTLYNLLYKSAEAIGVYKKQKVLEELKFVGLGKGAELREVMDQIIKVLETQFK